MGLQERTIFYVRGLCDSSKALRALTDILFQGKLKRTKPFYRDQFEYLKKVAKPEVRVTPTKLRVVELTHTFRVIRKFVI